MERPQHRSWPWANTTQSVGVAYGHAGKHLGCAQMTDQGVPHTHVSDQRCRAARRQPEPENGVLGSDPASLAPRGAAKPSPGGGFWGLNTGIRAENPLFLGSVCRVDSGIGS